jgi:hypothetical protein
MDDGAVSVRPFYLETRGSLLDVNLTLAGTPCGRLYAGDVFPDRATVALLSAGS